MRWLAVSLKESPRESPKASLEGDHRLLGEVEEGGSENVRGRKRISSRVVEFR